MMNERMPIKYAKFNWESKDELEEPKQIFIVSNEWKKEKTGS